MHLADGVLDQVRGYPLCECLSYNVSSIRLRVKEIYIYISAKILNNKRMLAIGLKSVVVRGFDVFGNILHKVFRHVRGTSPENSRPLNNSSKSLHISPGKRLTTSAIKLISSAALAILAPQLLPAIP